MSWQNSICMSVGMAHCPNVNTLVLSVKRGKRSAIDEFYAATNTPLTKIDPLFFTTYGDDMGGLLFVGLISSTENYFRDVLGFILSVCPVSQAHAAEEKVQLGSLLWAEDLLQNRSAFEFMAFSSAQNIRTTVQKFACHQIKTNGNFDLMLKEYDKLCELRHAVVHSAHIVAGKNAIKLGLSKSQNSLLVRFQYSQLQAAGIVCTALVQAANIELFEAVVARWAGDWRSLPNWQPCLESALLKKIRRGFLSTRDETNKTIANKLSLKVLEKNIKLAFNI